MLDLSPEEVPHFGEMYWDKDDEWRTAVDAFLAQYGLRSIWIAFSGETPLADVLATAAASNPGTYYLLSGKSKNGTNHVVIGLDGAIVWDPALDESGIVGPCSDGLYWMEYMGSNKMRAA